MTQEYSVTVRREIAARAEDLFDAWLDAESLGSWFRPSGGQTRVETDPRVGGTFRFVMVSGDSSVVASGTYREIDRPHRLVFSWSSRDTSFRESIVTVTFQQSHGSTAVEIHQIGLPDDRSQASHQSGWSVILREFASTYEKKVGRE